MKKSKAAYIEWLNSDCGYSFAEWLGITAPTVEYKTEQNHWLYRFVRSRYNSNFQNETVAGEWCETQKAAKASYKAALKSHMNLQVKP